MRIGISLTVEAFTAVVVNPDGSTTSHAVAGTNRDVSGQLDALLRALWRDDNLNLTQAGSSATITLDVSGILRRDTLTPLHILRIAPRPPIDQGHEIDDSHSSEPQPLISHFSGGHTILGEELVPLDEAGIERLSREATPGHRYVIASAGSLVNAAHELRAGELLHRFARPTSVDFSHNFSHGSIAVRERTARVNSSLFAHSETLGTTLALTIGNFAPQIRAFVTTNDGGRLPLSRLPNLPVHSLNSGLATELIGAAAVCNVTDGRLIFPSEDGLMYGEVLDGVPTVVPTQQMQSNDLIASQTANVVPITAALLRGRTEPPTLLLRSGDEAAQSTESIRSSGIELVPAARTSLPLRALGAACAPLADWVNSVVNVSNASEMEQALAAARSRVDVRLVSFGADPSQVRTVESRVLATAYQHPRVVSVRVRGIARSDTSQLLEPRAEPETQPQ